MWHNPTLSYYAGIWLIFYHALVTFAHCRSRGLAAGIYESFWACNIALVTAAYGMVYQSSEFISAALAMTILAHSLWLIDFITYCVIGKFPIGNAKYFVWRSTGILEKFTTLHHAWFLPLCFYILHGNGRLDISGLGWSWILSIFFGGLCKLFPKMIDDHYINVNMAHEFWRDVKLPLVHKFDPPKAPWLIYFSWMIVLLNTINTICYTISSVLWDLVINKPF